MFAMRKCIVNIFSHAKGIVIWIRTKNVVPL
jgi:hypothetical protein